MGILMIDLRKFTLSIEMHFSKDLCGLLYQFNYLHAQ